MGAARPQSERACRLRAPGTLPVADWASRAEHEPAIPGNEARVQQLGAEWRCAYILAVDLADDELAGTSVAKERAESSTGGDGNAWVVCGRQGLERGPTALQGQGEEPINEHDVRAGCSLDWEPGRVAAAG